MSAFKFGVGSIVEGQFTEDDIWYQARIDAVQPDGKFAVTYLEYGNTESIPSSRIRPYYQVGDKVEGQFTEDDVWYEARIDAITPDRSSFSVTYLEYGNSEQIPIERLRPLANGATWKVGDAIEGQFTEDDVWYPAKIDAISPDGKTFSVTYTEYGNSETITVERIRAPSQPAQPAQPKWKVGDLIEGQFTEDDVWYPAKIDAISSDGKSFSVTYTEYGNAETITEERIRAPSASSPVTAPAQQVQPAAEQPAEDSWASSSSSFSTSDSFGGSSGFSSQSSDKPPSNVLFVGGLSYQTDENSLQAAFEKYGAIDKVRLVKDRDTGKSKGFGYVEFFDVETAQKALQEANGQDLDGRAMRIDFSQPKGSGSGGFGGPRSSGSGGFGKERSGGFGGGSASRGSDKPPSNVLFVGGLSFDTEESALEAAFQEFGSIDKVRIVKDRDSGKSKGFGYVEFLDVETAERAMKEANGREVEGRQIRLDFSQPKGSGPSSGGFGGGRKSESGGFGGSSSFGNSSSSTFGSDSQGFGSNQRKEPAPAQISVPRAVEEPFDPSTVNPNRKVTVSSNPAEGPTLIVTRSFQDTSKKSSLFAHIGH